jgi:hypothetical protein
MRAIANRSWQAAAAQATKRELPCSNRLAEAGWKFTTIRGGLAPSPPASEQAPTCATGRTDHPQGSGIGCAGHPVSDERALVAFTQTALSIFSPPACG